VTPLHRVIVCPPRSGLSQGPGCRSFAVHPRARSAEQARAYRHALLALIATSTGACSPTVAVGTLFCMPPPDAASNLDSGAPSYAGPAPTVDLDATIAQSWSTGFEDGFCDYALPTGFCYTAGPASYTIVTSPVHSGRYAAAFTASVFELQDGGMGSSQARCVEQGVFPAVAYYGAWYYVPAPATNTGDWNLLHFQSGDGGPIPLNRAYLWDVSLTNVSDGGIHISFFDFVNMSSPDASAVPPIPIGQWFHIEVYFKRAADSTGEISVWQDGEKAMDLSGLVTDPANWGQWYVGNLVTGISPAESVVYVDDVSIRSSL